MMPVRKEGQLSYLQWLIRLVKCIFPSTQPIWLALIVTDIMLKSLCLRSSDAERALQLLEGYHAKLTKPQDQALRSAIERVIRIFQSNLFHSLLGMYVALGSRR